MIKREITKEFIQSAAEYPVVTVLGPRQSGKTTLSRMTFPDMPYRSLENPDTRHMAQSDPRGFSRNFLKAPFSMRFNEFRNYFPIFKG